MKKNILVTATGGRSVGSGILHALVRSSPEVSNRWNVIAADAESFSWGLYIAPNSIILPFANADNYLEEIKKNIEKFNIDAIIPGSEIETQLLSQEQDNLQIPIICNVPEIMPLMMDKFKMTEKLKELNIPFIETFPISDWQIALNKYDFPFIVKPTKGTGGSKGLHFIFNKTELEELIPSIIESNQNYCIQPYIGSGEDEYTVGVLSDKEGNIIDSIVMKRKLIGLSLLSSKKYNNFQYDISTGYSQGYFIKHKQIQDFCEKLAKDINSKGPLNIQLRIKDNQIYVFEIHPRFSGTSTMRADVGFNEPDILLRNHLYNEKFGRINYQYDVAVIRAFEHVVVPINLMK